MTRVSSILQLSFPLTSPRLDSDEVHVWCASVDLSKQHLLKLAQSLSREERERADRFYFAKDRDRFIAARGIFRFILSSYLSIGPSQLRFGYGPYGKPMLIPSDGSKRLCFNMSHSHGLALYGITRNRELGVDLERVASDFSIEEIAKQFFSAQEKSELSALPPSKKMRAFYACWTRKQAYIKARGEGLSIPLDQFDVSVNPEESAPSLHIRGKPEEGCRWFLTSFTPCPDYMAVLAVEGHRLKVRHRYWRVEPPP